MSMSKIEKAPVVDKNLGGSGDLSGDKAIRYDEGKSAVHLIPPDVILRLGQRIS